MQYIEGEEAVVWAKEQLKLDVCTASRAVGIASNGVVRAVVLFTDFRQSSIDMHVVSDGKTNWCFKGFLHLLFNYAFNVLKVERITAPVSSINTKARTLVEKLGFEIEAVLPKAEFGNDRILYVLWKNKSKWGRTWE